MARQIVLTNAATQQINVIGNKGEIIPLIIYFLSTQNGWVFDLSYQDFIINGIYLTISPNCLRQYRNILPFGILCNSKDGYEPQFINDFLDGRVSLYLLDAAEVLAVEADIYS